MDALPNPALVSRAALDARSGRLLADLETAGARTMLLKGASFAELLYHDRPRTYADVDLLVHPDDLVLAEEHLKGHDFELLKDDVHGCHWRRGSFHVDVHRTVSGVGVDARTLWARLDRDAEFFALGGEAVRTLSPAARVLTVVLHAAQHGARVAKPLGDLRRALEVIPIETWRDATALASELSAEPAYRVGLELEPAGRDLLSHLPVGDAHSLEASLRAATAPPSAVGLVQFFALGSWRARASFARARLFPRPALIRAQSRVARGSQAGLAVAYFTHLVGLAARLPVALVAIDRVRRKVRARAPRDDSA